ncbi:hypothetical protein GCM10007420_09670 [Glycocaulis albus]|uniref:Uncharacterized protein n=1 Tax=Glycocaulis albus TaxID=1382801 RepID=A0ABQ1XKG5_9PROT|nr:hypothetical protein GCM10007420_09670 [Glycocaulis albus]
MGRWRPGSWRQINPPPPARKGRGQSLCLLRWLNRLSLWVAERLGLAGASNPTQMTDPS